MDTMEERRYLEREIFLAMVKNAIENGRPDPFTKEEGQNVSDSLRFARWAMMWAKTPQNERDYQLKKVAAENTKWTS
jgi:hypothetical protein